jgi:signal transduction histidine kinase
LVTDVTDADLADFAANADQLRVYREIGFRSAMIVPLRVGERLLGAIILATDESGRRYGQDDMALATDLASRAALAIENTRLYQDAQAAIRTRDDFLSIAAHELKTPVTGMVGYSQLLQRRVEQEAMLNARDRQALRVIGEQAKRLSALVGTLLDVSRIETGHFTLDCQPVDLCALVQQVLEEIQPTLEQHTLTYTGPDVSLRIDGDAMRLEQVLQNLVQNAIKYSPDGSPIMVRVERQGDQATIAVSDRGIGIPPDAQAHLFERFFRAPNVGRSSIGVGIGLYVVKQIVDRHNGTIDVESAEGLGSTFTVRLPLA